MSLNILLVDEWPVFRAGLAALFEGSAEFRVVGEADRARDAIVVADQLAPDLVILGLHGDVRAAVDVIRALRRRRPPVPVLALAAAEDTDTVAAVVRAGVRGCLTIGSSGGDLACAVRMVAAGSLVFAGPVAEQLSPLFDGFGQGEDSIALRRLSRREQETLRLVAQGYDNRRIAKELFLAEKTVRNHVSTIMAKLGVPSRAAAVAAAWGSSAVD
ncbi:LuxR C-terminal-related transcriptional regulator [Catenulispora sp. MAP12-49]|uniref:LuxR C-terminal-related transcriptional regulator n=1 Tax=Catenulispora sp. MAP12-49 TaxID=3156302 RepID=UPI003511C4DE